MKAMILAAGVGSRLDPLTRTTPKPMVPVLGVPVMTHIIHLLKAHGFTDIIANTHYLADVLEDHYKAHPVEGVSLTFNREAELLGTAGGLKRVQDQLGFFDSEEPFLVVGGDDLTAINLTQMLEFHRKNGAIATIGLTEVEDPSQFGVVVLNGDNIERFVEKPAPGTAPSNTVNMGVYLFSPQILNHIPSGEFYDFGKNVFPEILEADQPFCGFVSKDYWRDVGNLREYRDVQGDFFEGLVELQTGLSKNSDGNYLGEGVEIDANAQIEAPVSIGAGSKIGAGARLGKGSILGQNVVVGENATIEKSILWDGAKIGTGTFLSGSIVGYDVEVSSSAGIFGAVVVPAKK